MSILGMSIFGMSILGMPILGKSAVGLSIMVRSIDSSLGGAIEKSSSKSVKSEFARRYTMQREVNKVESGRSQFICFT